MSKVYHDFDTWALHDVPWALLHASHALQTHVVHLSQAYAKLPMPEKSSPLAEPSSLQSFQISICSFAERKFVWLPQ